jgi:hypothetical protein
MFCHGCLFADRNSQMLSVSEIMTICILGQLFSVCLLIDMKSSCCIVVFEVKAFYAPQKNSPTVFGGPIKTDLHNIFVVD